MPHKSITLDSLAVFGGPPAFADALHVGRPNIADPRKFLDRMADALARRWLSNHGLFAEQFESLLARILGVKHAIVVANATLGLEVVLRAGEVTGEVILPAFTFVATAHAAQWVGLRPVLADVAPGTHHLDPAEVERLITPATGAIVGVHVWGEPCDVEALTAIADRRGAKLFFDAAHALGCSHGGRMIGNFGLAEVFSFHATKFVNAFEGGAITTNDDELARRVRLMIDFGIDGPDRVRCLGTNAKMSEASAAMGLTNLEHLDELVAANYRNYQIYQRGLQWLDGIRFFAYNERERRNYQYVPIEVDEQRNGISRDEISAILTAENVLARRYFYPGVHRMEPYRTALAANPPTLFHTDELCRQVLLLPTGTSVGTDDVHWICELIRWLTAHGAEVRSRLRAETPATVIP